MNPLFTAGAVSAALLLSGCILRDEVTTISIHPDGSASLVVFHSNVRSTEKGTKGENELRQYAEDFDARRSDIFTRIEEAEGEVVDARWMQKTAPYASVLVARLPTSIALEKFCSIRGEGGDVQVATRYSETGARRKLTMVASPPEGFKIPDDFARTRNEALQDRANGFSEIRMAVMGGQIVASKGWTIASDNQSALFCLDEVARLLRSNPDGIDLFIEWEVAVP